MKTLSETSIEHWLSSAESFAASVETAETITSAYAAHADAPPHAREAAVLAAQFPAMFQPVQPRDAFAGRVLYPLVGLSPEAMGLGYYCATSAWQEGAKCFPACGTRVKALLEFWAGNTTQEKCRAACPSSVRRCLPSDKWTEDSGVAFPLYRMAGTTLDYAALLRLGLDGLGETLAGSPFSHVVPLLRGTLDRYRAAAGDDRLRDTLDAIRHSPPETFRQAIQLFWLYALHSGTWNYGRLDDILGPFLAHDLDNGLLTEAEALDLLCSLWRLMHAYSNQYNNRVIIGGRGRQNEAAADRFALLAIEATRRVRLNQPQLSLRFHRCQSAVLWERALDAIGEGCTFPMLYNDDVNVPALARALSVPEALAEHYTPFGCGEIVLGCHSIGSPNGVINLLKALEVALHGGRDPLTGVRVVPGAPTADQMTDFESLWATYDRVVRWHVEALAEAQSVEYRVTAETAPFAFLSALFPGCVERRLSAFGGGVEMLGATLETYGNTNAADSLHAINDLVFQQRRLTLPELVDALDRNFEGHADLQAACAAVTKYGNDEGTSDAMALRVHEHICKLSATQAAKVGLHSHLVVIINNWANTVLGWKTGASADGRPAGQPMANGNNPAPGADQSGPTAFLNSLASLPSDLHAGAVQNMKFGKEWFTQHRAKLDALLHTYFSRGGTQAMITVVSRQDLESALREPEKWGHLMVRVGGFSIRFVDLPREAQMEVLERTLH